MSKQSEHHHESPDDGLAGVGGDSQADQPTRPTSQDHIRPLKRVATPRGQRRRVDPDGDALPTAPATRPEAQRSEPQPDTRPDPDPNAGVALGTEPRPIPAAEARTEPATQVAAPRGATAAPLASGSGARALPTEPLEDSFEDAAAARAKARDQAAVGSPKVAKALQIVLGLLAPIVILIGMIRLVASPVFLWLEYHRPGFPADQFGMDTEQRLTLGSYGVDYLFNLAPPTYLADLRFANGNAVFTDGEVGHMADVKMVMLVTMLVGLILAVVCVIAMIMLYRMRKGAIARSLFAGAVWFTGVVIIVVVVAAFGWEAFFAGFHQVFFADGTWTFASSDSLIRLYPGQFWIDAAAWVAGLTLVTMLVTIICTAPTARRRYRREQAQRFMESQVTGRETPLQS